MRSEASSSAHILSYDDYFMRSTAVVNSRSNKTMNFDPDPDSSKVEGPELRADFAPNSYEEWRQAAESLLKGAPFEKVLHSRTYEGIELRPIFNPEDTTDLPHLGEMPGFSGYSRGYRARGYLNYPWEISQELPCSTPEEFNQTALGELERGQSELNILVDLATQNGRDPDDARIGEVGACGVSLATLADMGKAFAGINLPMLIRLAGARKEMTLGEAAEAARTAGRNYITLASEFLGQHA